MDLSQFDTPKVRRVVRWFVAVIPLLLTAPLLIDGLFSWFAFFWLQFTVIIALFQYPWWSEEPLDVRLKYLHWMPWYISAVQRPILYFFGKGRTLGRWSFTFGWVMTSFVCSLLGILGLYLGGFVIWNLIFNPAFRKAAEDQMGVDPQATFLWVVFVRSRIILAVMFVLTLTAWGWVNYQNKKDSQDDPPD